MKHIVAALTLSFFAGCQTTVPSQSAPKTEALGLLEGISSGKTPLIDLGHALNAKNPYWPGSAYEPFKFEIFATIEKDHVLSGKFSMDEHTGTHLDAPNHFVEGQVSVDKIPLKQVVRARCCD